MRATFKICMALALSMSLLTSCTCDHEEDKPNLEIPLSIAVSNPYNGAWGTYVNEWYYCPRFAQPWPCFYDCNYVPTGFTCNGWNNQQGYFYWGQCIPPLFVGDVVYVHRYITNTATPVEHEWWCDGSDDQTKARPNTTRIVVKDPNGSPVEQQDKQIRELGPGEWDVFTYSITLGENGATTYEIITDYFDDVDESDESDNTSGVPGLTFE